MEKVKNKKVSKKSSRLIYELFNFLNILFNVGLLVFYYFPWDVSMMKGGNIYNFLFRQMSMFKKLMLVSMILLTLLSILISVINLLFRNRIIFEINRGCNIALFVTVVFTASEHSNGATLVPYITFIVCLIRLILQYSFRPYDKEFYESINDKKRFKNRIAFCATIIVLNVIFFLTYSLNWITVYSEPENFYITFFKSYNTAAGILHGLTIAFNFLIITFALFYSFIDSIVFLKIIRAFTICTLLTVFLGCNQWYYNGVKYLVLIPNAIMIGIQYSIKPFKMLNKPKEITVPTNPFKDFVEAAE